LHAARNVSVVSGLGMSTININPVPIYSFHNKLLSQVCRDVYSEHRFPIPVLVEKFRAYTGEELYYVYRTLTFVPRYTKDREDNPSHMYFGDLRFLVLKYRMVSWLKGNRKYPVSGLIWIKMNKYFRKDFEKQNDLWKMEEALDKLREEIKTLHDKMTIIITPKSKYAKEKVKLHGEKMLLIRDDGNKFYVKSFDDTWDGQKWQGQFVNRIDATYEYANKQ
jgi:hypothetical protein